MIATGGHTGNVNFRRMFDPRLTEEYQQAGMPYSFQGADGELAAMDVGASLWATGTQTSEVGPAITKTRHVGTRWGYLSLYYELDSPIFHLAKATGLTVTDWHEAILVNQFGKRFWNELDSSYDYINAALGNHGDTTKLNGGGPIWAIFDADAVARQKWKPAPPHVDPDGYFASADTVFELAGRIRNPYQKQPIAGAVLQETVNRYNSFVDVRRRCGFWQAHAAAHDLEAAVLCGMGDADPARLADGFAHRHQRAGDRHSRRGDPGAVQRGRIPGRLRPAWARPLPGVRPHRRAARGATEFVRGRMADTTSVAVWDVPMPVVAGERFSIKVGATSGSGRGRGQRRDGRGGGVRDAGRNAVGGDRGAALGGARCARARQRRRDEIHRTVR